MLVCKYVQKTLLEMGFMRTWTYLSLHTQSGPLRILLALVQRHHMHILAYLSYIGVVSVYMQYICV
jgi:hypothetical protein